MNTWHSLVCSQSGLECIADIPLPGGKRPGRTSISLAEQEPRVWIYRDIYTKTCEYIIINTLHKMKGEIIIY